MLPPVSEKVHLDSALDLRTGRIATATVSVKHHETVSMGA